MIVLSNKQLEIYFDFKSQLDIKEDHPWPKKAANHYIASKRLAEQLVDEAVINKQLQAITIRPRAIFGPYDRALVTKLLQLPQLNQLHQAFQPLLYQLPRLQLLRMKFLNSMRTCKT